MARLPDAALRPDAARRGVDGAAPVTTFPALILALLPAQLMRR